MFLLFPIHTQLFTVMPARYLIACVSCYFPVLGKALKREVHNLPEHTHPDDPGDMLPFSLEKNKYVIETTWYNLWPKFSY